MWGIYEITRPDKEYVYTLLAKRDTLKITRMVLTVLDATKTHDETYLIDEC